MCVHVCVCMSVCVHVCVVCVCLFSIQPQILTQMCQQDLIRTFKPVSYAIRRLNVRVNEL